MSGSKFFGPAFSELLLKSDRRQSKWNSRSRRVLPWITPGPGIGGTSSDLQLQTLRCFSFCVFFKVHFVFCLLSSPWIWKQFWCYLYCLVFLLYGTWRCHRLSVQLPFLCRYLHLCNPCLNAYRFVVARKEPSSCGNSRSFPAHTAPSRLKIPIVPKSDFVDQ